MKKRGIGKRLLSILLAGCLMVSLTACSSQNDQDDKGKDTAKNDGTESRPEKIEVTFGRMTIPNGGLPEGDTVEDNAYTRWVEDILNIDIKDAFEANMMDGSYDRQVSLALSSGDLPDIMLVSSRETLKELADNDMIEDLTGVWDQYATDTLKGIINSYGDAALDKVTFDGKMMGIPATTPDTGPTQVWVRSDWMQELGIKVDEDQNKAISLDELKMIAKEFKDKNPGKAENPVGMAFVPNLSDDGIYTMSAISAAFGAYPRTWLESDGQVTYGSLQPQTKDTLSLAAEWYKEGIIDPQLGTRTWDDITSLLVNGQLGITFGMWHVSDWLLNNVREADKNANFEVYGIEDANGKVNAKHVNPVGFIAVVRKGFEHPEIAVQISNMFYDSLRYSPESFANYPEVVKYVEVGGIGVARPMNMDIEPATSLLDNLSDIQKGVNGEIKAEEARTKESQDIIVNIKAYLADPANASTTDWAKYHSRMKGIGLLQALTESGTINYVSPVFPLTTSTMQTAKVNLDKLEDETFLRIVTGALPADSGFQDFVSQWNKQGGEQIIKEIQDQIK